MIYRTKPAAVSVTDPAAALSWAQEHLPDAVTLHLDKKALSDRLTATGEALPFAAFQPAEEVFYIK
jgi:endonuclease/exonuclease/phosphatase (EEP) superfamily protein YafD